jgi:hypothetical protein
MYKESADRLQGNDAFEGYGIDLIAEISQILSKEVTNVGFMHAPPPYRIICMVNKHGDLDEIK